MVVGETVNLYSETRREIERIVVHEGFRDFRTLENDIALIKIKGQFRNAKSIVFISVEKESAALRDGAALQVYGWGVTGSNNKLSATLRQGNVEIINRRNCNDDFYFGSITQNKFCAGGKGNGTCSGDSGGPIVYLLDGVKYQVGITSLGLQCEQATVPSAYTRVSPYLDWISKKKAEIDCPPGGNRC
jgi:secreted trypsin-like serine protease